MAQAVVGLFLNAAQARKVASELGGLGIPAPSVEVLDAYVTALDERLSRAGVPGEDAAIYLEGLRRGGALVLAAVENGNVDAAGALMDDYGAADIDEFGDQWGRPAAAPSSVAKPEPDSAPSVAEVHGPLAEAGQTLSLIAMDRSLGGPGGGLDVRGTVVETPVEHTVPVLEENITVECRPAGRDATPEDFEAFKQGVLEFIELSEEIVVEKRARVVEEVVITKRVRERLHTVKETVKQTQLTMAPRAERAHPE